MTLKTKIIITILQSILIFWIAYMVYILLTAFMVAVTL